jgi:hypothetical protein
MPKKQEPISTQKENQGEAALHLQLARPAAQPTT